MKNGLVKVCSLVLVLTMLLCGCAAPEAAPAMETEAAVAASRTVTFLAEGKTIILEDTEGKTLEQLLEQARITLDEGDVLTLSPELTLDDNLTIQVMQATAQPAPTEPEEPTEPETKPASTERTVVSVEVYNDCDDSGHGVKVITYSDGTQEEVYF